MRVSSPKVRRIGIALALAVLATACWAVGTASRERPEAVPAVRPGRVVSIDGLRMESAFPPLVPAAMPEGFALDRIEMATVDQLEGKAVSPPRQAVRFVYRRADHPGTINVVETPRRDGMAILDILSANYFADWYVPDSCSLMMSRTMGEIEYVLLSGPPINSQTLEQLQHVPWVAPWKAPDGNLRPLPILPDPVVGDVGTEDVGAKWLGKPVTLSELRMRCSFRPQLPCWLPAHYELHAPEIVWVVAGSGIPAQHAVRLIYAREGQSRAINVIEIKHAPGDHNWAAFLIGQGYFADFQADPLNRQYWGSVDGIDFVVVSKVELGSDRLMSPKEWRPLTPADARASPCQSAPARQAHALR